MSMNDKMRESLLKYTLHLADNRLILGQRLGEWCGHGPVLEQDIALTNIALDLIGQARLLYQYASETDPKGRDEDQLAFLRTERNYLNLLLVEQPNGDFAQTIARQFFFDVFNFLQTEQLCNSEDETLRNISIKALKEIRYHVKYSSDWVRRLGDGTSESHTRMQRAIEALWKFTPELFEAAQFELELSESGIAFRTSELHAGWSAKVKQVLNDATLTLPNEAAITGNGKEGIHSEHLGYILAEMQYMQRTYPGLKW